MHRTLFIIAISVAACGGDNQPPRPDAAGIELEVGTGTTSFVPLSPGDSLEIVAGPQGGWHVDVSALFSGISPDGAIVRYSVVDGDTSLSFPSAYRVFSTGLIAQGDAWLHLGRFAQLDIATAAEAVGRDVALRVTIEPESGGVVATDERDVTLVDDEQ